MSNFKKAHIGNEARTELHETLDLTGAEISINRRRLDKNIPCSQTPIFR